MSNSVEFIKHDRTMPTDNWYKISYFLSVGDEKEAAKIIDYRLGNASHMQQRALLLYMDSFTDKKLLFDLILSVYTNDGYDFPKKIIVSVGRKRPFCVGRKRPISVGRKVPIAKT